MYEIREYIGKAGKSFYRRWLEKLDGAAKARIQARIFRFETGNLGDHKSVGKGVYEARLDFGPGYRVYFGIEERRVIMLLGGGDKATQARDIERAQMFWKEYLEDRHRG